MDFEVAVRKGKQKLIPVILVQTSEISQMDKEHVYDHDYFTWTLKPRNILVPWFGAYT
jgi:hypothetical protein